jgi:hypothetical protein
MMREAAAGSDAMRCKGIAPSAPRPGPAPAIAPRLAGLRRLRVDELAPRLPASLAARQGRGAAMSSSTGAPAMLGTSWAGGPTRASRSVVAMGLTLIKRAGDGARRGDCVLGRKGRKGREAEKRKRVGHRRGRS